MRIDNLLEGSTYLKQMRDWALRDAGRIDATKSAAPRAIVFTNLEFPLSIDYPILEAKAAISAPSKYYQALKPDSAVLRNEWAHDYCRGIAFAGGHSASPTFPSGKGSLSAWAESGQNGAPFSHEEKAGGELLLISKAVAKRQGAEFFDHYLALKFGRGEFSFEDKGNGRFIIAVQNMSKQGTDLLSGSPTSHTFSFAFEHHPTKMATMSSSSFRANALSSSMYASHGGLAQRSDESVITVPHFAPHPYLLADFARLGYASRHAFQDDISALLAEQFKLLQSLRPEPQK